MKPTNFLSKLLSIIQSRRKTAVAVLLVGLSAAIGLAATGGKTDAVVHFAGVDYLHRWSKDNQHEFTPRGQENLEHWTDMITLNYYPDVKDGEALAKTASAVVDAYRDHRAMILKTSSVPRTADKPAEHFVAVILPTHDLLEAASARFEIVNGVGVSVVSSHREYGTDVGNQMIAWLQKNGSATEDALKGLDKIPAPGEMKH